MWNREDLEKFVGLDYDPGSGAIEGPLGDVARIYYSRNRNEQCDALGALLAASPRLAVACQSALALAELIEEHGWPAYDQAPIPLSEVLRVSRALDRQARAALAAAGVATSSDDPAETAEEPEGPAARAERRADRHERLHNRDGKVGGVDR